MLERRVMRVYAGGPGDVRTAFRNQRGKEASHQRQRPGIPAGADDNGDSVMGRQPPQSLSVRVEVGAMKCGAFDNGHFPLDQIACDIHDGAYGDAEPSGAFAVATSVPTWCCRMSAAAIWLIPKFLPARFEVEKEGSLARISVER